MRSFSFYEFASCVVPGTVGTTAILIAANLPEEFMNVSLAIQATVFGAFSYACGQLMQLIGKEVERVALWRCGEPAAWLRLLRTPSDIRCECGKRRLLKLLSDPQQQALARSPYWGALAPASKAPHQAWEHFLRGLTVQLRRRGHAGRHDYLTSTYALCRGLAAAFLLLAGAFAFKHAAWPAAISAVGAILLLLRTQSLKVSSTQEVLLQAIEPNPTFETSPESTEPSQGEKSDELL
jgi:hypothetical protein